jgi:hypothetical protein
MMPAEQRERLHRRMKPEQRLDQLLPLTSGQLERLDHLIETLMELRDILDGDVDREGFSNDGDPAFPGDPLAEAELPFYCPEAGPGDAVDAEEEPAEDSDAGEPSYNWVTTRSGRLRMV